jgi:hypothetical protein
MQMIKKIILLVIIALFYSFVFSQNVPQLQKLKDYVQQNIPQGYDSSSKNIYLFHGDAVNYLYPLYQLFRDEKKFKKGFGYRNYYDQLSQYISFTEDYQSSLQYAIKGYDTVSIVTQKQILKTVDGLKNIQHVEARKYISFVAKNYKVVMLNEAHNKPVHRAFAISLLPGLYKKGFRYLAMEMLNNYSNNSLTKLNAQTGHYSAEPIAGELIRTALELGFKLVAYEDTLAYSHTASQRDSAQAENIYTIIKEDSAAKIFVLAGYGHIAKRSLDDKYVPMAMALKKISGIDPLTIDQTEMTEESNIEYGRLLYRAYTQKFAVTFPSIALIDNDPVNITNNTDYDLSVIHPPTAYRDGRATWLALDGLRKPLYVKPAEKNSFLVQAYYENETHDNGPAQLIPADQTYIPTNKENYLLYLKKGKYIIVFRDMDYKILSKLNIEVN